MRHFLRIASFAAIVCLVQQAIAQSASRSIVIKNGESIDLMPVFGEKNCQSILSETPSVEVLETPPEIKVAVREEMVMPRRTKCKDKIKGGVIVITANDIKARTEGKLTFRVKYKGKEGDKQSAFTYNVTLFPN